jgi:hypothetical protein
MHLCVAVSAYMIHLPVTNIEQIIMYVSLLIVLNIEQMHVPAIHCVSLLIMYVLLCF